MKITRLQPAAVVIAVLSMTSVAAAAPPTYDLYPAPAPLGQSAGEPSIGVNWNTGKVFFIASLETLRVSFDDSSTPATASWEDVSFPLTSLATLDPILFTDPQTGRTFVAQLAPFGIQSAVFPAVVAGDPDRAAFAFLGTPTGGDGTGTNVNFPGAWHLYVATTTDGGATWTTVNATPGDPVQRGAICLQGTTCGAARNLLDFMDVAVDEEGRVLVAFADGCVGSCVAGPPNSGVAIGVIARQSGGPRLFAVFD